MIDDDEAVDATTNRRRARSQPPIEKERPTCHSSGSTTSPSRSTASAPERVRAPRRISVTPGTGCTDGCSPPEWWQPGAAAASTTLSSASTTRGSAPRSWAPGSSATPDGTRTRTGRAPGAPTRRSIHRSSSSPTTPARRSRWRAARHSTSSTPRRPRRSSAAREAADGQDVRIGGGPTVVRDFLAAGLIDHLHVVVVPILLGRGVRLWDGLEGHRAGTTGSRPPPHPAASPT